MKTVSFGKPKVASSADADQWVQNTRDVEREGSGASAQVSPVEAMKRFTIDVPLELHRRIKTQCAMRGSKMTDVLRELLEKEFPKS